MTEMTRAELQAYLDANIRNETVDLAITPAEVATAVQNLADSVPGWFVDEMSSVVLDDDGNLRRGDTVVITDKPYKANRTYNGGARNIKVSAVAGSNTITWNAGAPSTVLFRDGNPVLILGAGANPNLATPDPPVVTVAGTPGSTSYDVVCVAATRHYAMSLPSAATNVPNGPAACGETDFLRVYKPATDHPEAYWFIIYGRKETDPYRLWGVISAHELHGDSLSVGQVYPSRFDRKNMIDNTTKFWPAAPIGVTRANYLEAYIVSGQATATMILDRPAVSNAGGTDIFPNLPLAIEDALKAGGTGARVRVPGGSYCWPRPLEVFQRCTIKGDDEDVRVEIIDGVTAMVVHSDRTGPMWQPAVPVRVGDRCWPNVSLQSTYGYVCTVAGTTGTTHPSFSTSGPTTDGTVTWSPVTSGTTSATSGHTIRGFTFGYWMQLTPCGPWCFWDNINVGRVGDTTGGYWPGACVVSYTRANIERISVSGCYGSAFYSYSPGRIASNANLSRWRDLRSGTNRGSAVVLDGYDNNSCTIQDCLSLSDSGTGYVDRSLSGCVWINCNVEGSTTYSHQNAGNGMTLIYCYAEGPRIDVFLGTVIAPSSFGTMTNRCYNGSNILGRPWECGQYSRTVDISPNPHIRIAPGNSPYILEWGAKASGHEYGIHSLYYMGGTKEWAIMKNTGDANTATMFMAARTLRRPWMVYWKNGIWIGDGLTDDVVQLVAYNGLPSYGLHKPGSLMIDQNTGAIYTASEPSGSSSISWLPSHNYHRGTYLEPTTPNGFVYQNTGADETQSGTVEPTWPTTPGVTVGDGSTQWKCWGPAVDPVQIVPTVARSTYDTSSGGGPIVALDVTLTTNSDNEVTIVWQAQDSSGNLYFRKIKNWIRRDGATVTALASDTVEINNDTGGAFTGSGNYTLTTGVADNINVRVVPCTALAAKWRMTVSVTRYPMRHY